ncbi:MAG: SpaA isopeptide-forming pilin-related protein, partial [Oscillospiraceae bacterium]
MTSKKSSLSRALAFATAFALFLTLTFLIPPGSMKATADDENAVPVEQAGMTITAFSVKLNGNELKKGDSVRNGDQLDLTFKWELPNDHEFTDSIFVCGLEDKLFGIDLQPQIIPVGDIAIYKISGNKLYIQLLEGSIGRSGSCELSGTISVTKDQVDEDGKFTLKFFDKSIEVIAPEFTTPGLYITKENSGSVTYNADDGKYYQTFNIVVGSNGQDSENVSIKDLGTSLYDFSGVSLDNIKVYEGSADITDRIRALNSGFSSSADGFALQLGTVTADWNKTIRIEYTTEVTSDILSPSLSWDDRKNTAQVYVNDKLQQTNSGYAQFTPPSVVKTGTLSADKSEISWTVTVYLNDYKDVLFSDENKKITLTDILDSALGSEAAEALSTAFGGSTSINLNKDDFSSDGEFSITYTTPVPEKLQDSPINNSVKNTAQINYETYDQQSEKEINIPGTIGNFAAKSCSADGDNINWTITVDIPDVDNITGIDIDDYMDFDSNFISDSTVFTVTDGSGTSIDLTAVGRKGWYNNHQFQIYITDTEFLNNNRNKTVTITYTTPSNDVSKVTNTATVNFKFRDESGDEKTVTKTGTAVYAIPGNKSSLTLSNIYYENMGTLKGAMAWCVSVTKGDVYAAGDVIKVTDSIPASEGLIFVEDSVAVNIDSKYYFNHTQNDGKFGAGNIDISVSADGKNITITVTLNADAAAALNNSYSKAIDIGYITQMSDDEYISWLTGGVSKDYSNNAVIYINENAGYPTGTVQAAVPDSGDIVNKYISSVISPTEEDINYYAVYTVEINKDKLSFFDDENSDRTYSAVDELGSNLKYVDGSITITSDPGYSAAPSVDISGNVITIDGLEDKIAYTVTYKVKVNQIFANDSYSDEEIANMFGNTVKVTIAGNNSLDSYTCLDENTYRSKADYTFQQDIKTLTIKGTKTWVSDSTSIRPSKITIKLEVTKTVTPSSSSGSETTTTVSNKEYSFTPESNSSSTWEYSITNLPVYVNDDASFTQYTYKVTEVTVDGYSVGYNIDGTTNASANLVNDNGKDYPVITIGTDTLSNAECTLDITNTFNADEVEVGTLKVSKIWNNENGDTSHRPDGITFTLKDETNTINESKTLNSLAENIEFTNLPLYTYSKSTDNSGNEILVRTPRKYTISEVSVDNYTTSYSATTFTLTTDTSYRSAMTTKKEITVINSYVAPTFSVHISKKDINGTDELAGARLEVYKAADYPNGTATKSWTSTGTANTISLEAGNYVLVETTAPDGYEIAENIAFTVNTDGTVSIGTEPANGNIITMFDAPSSTNTFEVVISKKDINGTDELAGARLAVYKAADYPNGTATKSWTS